MVINRQFGGILSHLVQNFLLKAFITDHVSAHLKINLQQITLQHSVKYTELHFVHRMHFFSVAKD